MNLIDKLPKNYTELNYKDYIKIILQIPAEKPVEWDEEEYNSFITLTPLSILLDKPIIELERLPATELIPLLKRIEFLNEPFTEAKTSLKLKSVDELSYDEFVTFQTLRQDQWVNMPRILQIIIKDLTPEQIDQLSIYEVMQCFFTLNKSTQKYMQSLKVSLGLKVARQNLKTILQLMIQKLKNLFRFRVK